MGKRKRNHPFFKFESGKQKTKVGDSGGCGSLGYLSGGWGIGLGRREEQEVHWWNK